MTLQTQSQTESRTQTLAQAAPAAASVRIQVPLSDLGLAPENLRAAEPEDADVPRLADTIRAAGLIYPPIVRKARRGEAGRFMVLDGRRRRFALLRLAADGAIAADHPVECVLAADRAAQAAAAVLPNAEHAPVHAADVILAIGKLRKARLSTAAIAEALGYDETEVRRLEAMAHVHPDVLKAFRLGRLTLRQVRLFARLKDRARQAELARDALGGYFHEHVLLSVVTRGRVTVQDPRFDLVSEAAYAAAGGRLSADLFGELPAEVLDPDTLDEVWRGLAAEAAAGLAGEGLAVSVSRERGYQAPDGLEHLPFVHWGSLPEEAQAAFGAARARIEAAEEALAAAQPDERLAVRGELLVARLALARLTAGSGEVAAVLLTPSADGIDATFYQRPAAEAPEDDVPDARADDDGPEDEQAEAGDRWRPDVVVPEVAVDIAGVSHLQQAARTAVAGQGLARDLLDRPQAALIALVAQLFKRLVLSDQGSADASALQVNATGGSRRSAVDGLDGEVWARLEARRAAYLAGGERPITYVARLEGEDRLDLLAELTAATVDLREARTTSPRPSARAEAAEIAALCDADLSRRWTPDASFLALHSRAQLLDFLADMQATPPKAEALRKGDLVQVVVAAAAERRWVPACLRWDRDAEVGGAGAEDPTETASCEDEPPAAEPVAVDTSPVGVSAATEREPDRAAQAA